MRNIRRYLVAGVLVWLPIIATVLVIRFLIGLMDRSLVLLPASWRPEVALGFAIPGLGAVLAFVVLLVTGVLATNLLGRRLVKGWEDFLQRIPLVRSIYGGVKGFAETLFSKQGSSFKKAMLVQYPRPGIWSLGFMTAAKVPEPSERTARDLICVFVPTTPNPTSGFIVLVPREEAIELDMSVDAAMKMIFTLGVVVPGTDNPPASGQPA
ncbi:MAG: DUF502 domain-containing protein [Steroidobacteraceae bacterium]